MIFVIFAVNFLLSLCLCGSLLSALNYPDGAGMAEDVVQLVAVGVDLGWKTGEVVAQFRHDDGRVIRR